jgi:hypothetical protein
MSRRGATTKVAEEDNEVMTEPENTEVVATEGAAAAEPATEEKAATPQKRKFPLPAGYITPVAFRHALVEAGLAGDNLSSAQIYILSRKAATNGIPVKHFDRDGKEYDAIQTNAAGETLTRPGMKLDEGLEWWKNRPKRQPGQKKEKAESNGDGAEAEAAAGEAALPEDELTADEDFVEAELQTSCS